MAKRWRELGRRGRLELVAAMVLLALAWVNLGIATDSPVFIKSVSPGTTNTGELRTNHGELIMFG